MESRVVLYTRLGCHLCDEARTTVAAVCAATATAWTEVDVDADDQVRAVWGDLVPVVTVDGVQRGFHRIDPGRVRTALTGPR